MGALFKNAVDEYNLKNYGKSFRIFYEVIISDIKLQTKIDSIDYIIDLLDKINIDKEKYNIIDIANIYYQIGNIEVALKLYQASSYYISSINIFKDILFKCFDNGQLGRANRIVINYFRYLLNIKNFSEGLNICDQLLNRGIDKDIYTRFKLTFLVQSGNINLIEDTLLKSYKDIKEEQFYELFGYLYNHFINDYNYWIQSEVVNKFFIKFFEKYLFSDNGQDINLQDRRNFIVSVYNYLLSKKENDDYTWIATIVSKYSIIYSRKELGLSSIELLNDQDSQNFYLEYLSKIEYDNQGFKEEEGILEQNIKEIEETSINAIEKLEKDIRFLIGIDDNKVISLIKKLETLDKDNPLIKEYYELFRDDNYINNTLDNGIIHVRDIKNNLLKEIRHYSKSKINNHIAEDNISDNLKKIKDINCKDAIIALFFIEEYQKALELLEELRDQQNIEIKYLKVIIYIEQEKYHDAFDIATDILQEDSILQEDIICFSYLKAECLFKMGNIHEAQSIYKIIKKENPNYRLIKYRLGII